MGEKRNREIQPGRLQFTFNELPQKVCHQKID